MNSRYTRITEYTVEHAFIGLLAGVFGYVPLMCAFEALTKAITFAGPVQRLNSDEMLLTCTFVVPTLIGCVATGLVGGKIGSDNRHPNLGAALGGLVSPIIFLTIVSTITYLT